MQSFDILGNLNYKQKKELENKARAGSSHNWNTLFLGQNAVADAIASRYNTTKEKVIADVFCFILLCKLIIALDKFILIVLTTKLLEDGSNGMSAAVKLALGETQLAQDTRNFLEENGVCLDAFNQVRV